MQSIYNITLENLEKILIENGKGILTVKEQNLYEFNKLLTEFYDTNNGEKLEQFLYEKCIFGIEK